MNRFILMICLIMIVSCSEEKQVQDIDLRTLVETAIIVKTDVIRKHHVPAVFMAVNRADLAFQLSGTIDRVLVNIGESVEENQALMSVYNPNIDSALDSNLAKLESLNVQINQVKKDVSKLQELRKNNSASQSALEQKETQYKDLKAQLKLVQSQIDLALANQSESIIKAPFSGTVDSSRIKVGEFVQAGQVVMTMNQQDKLEVEVNLTRSLWKNLELGDDIKGFNEDLSQSLSFTVKEKAQSADSKSHLLKVILELNENIDNAIGQQVTLEFPQNYQNVYQLPLETIVDDGINKPYIFTALKEKALKTYIQPLFIEDGKICFRTNEEIQGAVILKGQSKLSEGMRIKELK